MYSQFQYDMYVAVPGKRAHWVGQNTNKNLIISFLCRCGILDIFLSVIAKILCVQVKAKNGSNGKDVKMVVMSDFVSSQDVDSTKWYLKGNMSRELAAEVDCLMKDMSKVNNLDFFLLFLSWFLSPPPPLSI